METFWFCLEPYIKETFTGIKTITGIFNCTNNRSTGSHYITEYPPNPLHLNQEVIDVLYIIIVLP